VINALRERLIYLIGDSYFQRYRRGSSAKEAIFTRKVGHTQRGGRPIHFREKSISIRLCGVKLRRGGVGPDGLVADSWRNRELSMTRKAASTRPATREDSACTFMWSPRIGSRRHL
jgi:hypothetical protein